MNAFREASALSRPAWEYKLLSVAQGKLYTAEALLNDLGNEGWELVGSVPGKVFAIVFTLKRLRD